MQARLHGTSTDSEDLSNLDGRQVEDKVKV